MTTRRRQHHHGRSRLLVALVFALAVATGCGDETASREVEPEVLVEATRGVILISVDTLRADHLGAYGYPRPTSPTFDRLASAGTLFEHAVVQYPSTLTSHMTIFTGFYPQEHGVMPPSAVLSEAITTLPEIFQAHGFRTAGHTEGGFVAGGYGFSRGFDEFTDTPYSSDRDIERTYGRGLDFLRSLAPDERFFLFLHTYSVHDPYEPPAEYRQLFWPAPRPDQADSSGEALRRINQGQIDIEPATVEYFRAMYDASIRYTDDVLERFVAEVADLGLWPETTLVLTSDHGEEFREHGMLAHTQVYPESLHVPLLVLHPRQGAGRRVRDVVESVDLAPTLLELAGLSPPVQWSGRSLASHLVIEPADGRASQGYAEVFDVQFVRTVIAQDRNRRYQLVMVEPEWDPVGPWIRDRVTFDVDGETLRFEAQSYHEPRRVAVEVDGSLLRELEVRPGWQVFEIDLPVASFPARVTMAADGCVSPAEVGDGEDDRCLAFQFRDFLPRRFELYDLVADPLAARDLFRDEPDLRRRLAKRLLERQWQEPGEAAERVLSKEEEETLRALGYLD